MEEEERGTWIRRLGASGGGVLLALAVSLVRGPLSGARGPTLTRTGAVAWWVADRDADELCGLDADLLVARKIHVGAPSLVRATPDGGAWVVRSATGRASGPLRLLRIRADGATVLELECGPCAALEVLGGGDAAWIEKGTGARGADRLLRCGLDGRKRRLFEGPGLTCLGRSRGSLLAGSAGGEVLRWENLPADGTPSRTVLDGPVVALAPGDLAGGVFVLLGADGSRLGLLGPDLAIRWTIGTGLRCAHLGPVEGEPRVWLADLERPVVRRFGPGGSLELECTGLPAAGSTRVLACEGGGALVLAPGTILRLDQVGRLRPGQGGFSYVADVDRVRGGE